MRRKKPIAVEPPPPEDIGGVSSTGGFPWTWILWVVLGVGIGVAGAYIFVMYQLSSMWSHS